MKRGRIFAAAFLLLLLCAGSLAAYAQNVEPAKTQDSETVYRPNNVTRKAQVIDKPEPHYTEEARRHDVVGSVLISLVLNANGSVTNVVALTKLPDGLTEKAIEAARKIKFIPAEKDGHKVSQYAKIIYNFDIWYEPKDVSRLPVITFVPRLQMTEEARKNNAKGTVVLSVALSHSGTVEVMKVVKGLPYGLTENAIEAIKQMKFEPALRDGKPVSVILDINCKFPPD